jgi:hypothetical protein
MYTYKQSNISAKVTRLNNNDGVVRKGVFAKTLKKLALLQMEMSVRMNERVNDRMKWEKQRPR